MVGYEGNVERFSGFAADYDRHRFRPPRVLAEILCRYAEVERPGLVVDIGCGTGLSTRFWAGRAGRVIGIDPAEDMLSKAAAATSAASIEYRPGFGHETGLPDGSADIVTASQSFHWMEPTSTLAEVARVLRPGGVFAAYHYDSPAVTGIADLDRATVATEDAVYRLEKERGLEKALEFHGKDAHAKSLAACGAFRMTRTFHLHDVKSTTAERLIGGSESLGAIQTLRKQGCTDDELGLTALREAVANHIGDGEVPIYVSYEVHVGVC